AIVALLGAFTIVVLPRLEAFAKTLLDRLPLPHTTVENVTNLMEHGLRGIRTLHDPRRVSGFLALTAVIWSMDALAVVIGAAALGLSIPVRVALLLNAALGLGSALPSTPGYVGVYQFVAVTVLTPFGFTRTDAIAYILVAQAVT